MASQAEAPGNAVSERVAFVDLSHVDFAAAEVVLVPTRWDFYWRRFLEPADFQSGPLPIPDARVAGMSPWTEVAFKIPSGEKRSRLPANGFATYRMRLRVQPDREYGFRFQQQLTAFRVYANGELKLRGGRTGESRQTSRPERKHYSFYVRSDLEGRVELILHVSNFHLFRGGLRGVVALGEKSALDSYVNRKIVFDLVLLGFFGAVFLYHLALFAMHPGEASFLLFALLCLSFMLRVPFMNEKTVNLLFGEFPWELSLRSLGSINIISPALMMLFLRSLFPRSVSRKSVAPYLIVSLPFLGVHLLEIQYLAPAMFVLYLIAIVPMLSHAAYVTLRMGVRGSAGARVIAAGILLCVVFGFYAMYLNWKAEDAAPVALIAFAGLVLFQSVGLGQNYRDNLDARERLRMGLERSRAALAAQRKDLEINLHDSLGGALTDLQVLVERRLEDLKRNNSFDTGELLRSTRERLNQMSSMFRAQLLFMEDLELTARDPIIGLRMVLLRRYTDARREIEFHMDGDTIRAFQRAMADDRWRMDMLQLTRELCTNDLKYGAGESRWRFGYCKQSERLEIQQSNTERADTGAATGGERSAIRARDRARMMGGEFGVQRFGGAYTVSILLPLTPRDTKWT
ncbi:MAG: 7TM-DISM domain-containing protein [Leptospirales bacterium]